MIFILFQEYTIKQIKLFAQLKHFKASRAKGKQICLSTQLLYFCHIWATSLKDTFLLLSGFYSLQKFCISQIRHINQLLASC